MQPAPLSISRTFGISLKWYFFPIPSPPMPGNHQSTFYRKSSTNMTALGALYKWNHSALGPLWLANLLSITPMAQHVWHSAEVSSFLRPTTIPLYVYATLLIYPSLHGPLGCFHLVAILLLWTQVGKYLLMPLLLVFWGFLDMYPEWNCWVIW